VTSAHDTSRVATIGGLPVRTHDHVCVLYRGADQRDELMAEFLADGVRAGHRCYCLSEPDNHQRIAAAVSGRDERAAAEDPSRLDFVSPVESYVRGGEFMSDRMLRFWDDWGAATYERDSVTYARIGADMSWARPLVDAPGFVMDLARYETRFTLWARRYPQVTACLYDLDRFDGDVIVPIVRAHPKVWMNGVVLTNPYYLQSEHFSAAEADELTGHVAAPV
jgi:MEDS: MEthanogen/methylotroph, DcmR Sensory domain